MASQENDRPQSTGAVRRKPKGKKKVSKTTDSQSQKLVEVGMQDSLGRLVIAPSETNGFLPSTQSINVIMDSIKSFYRDAWISWGEIPVFYREQMWNHFRTKCAWYSEHDYQIFCNFELNARYMLNDILESAWEENQKHDWMLEDIWARLNEKWTTAKSQKTSIQAKAPRASNKGDSLHIGGLASIGTLQRKPEKKKGKTLTHDEGIEEKNVKNKKDDHNTLVEPHVERPNVGYKRSLDELRQSQPTSEDDSSEDQSPDDDEGGVKKAKIRGLGSEHCLGCIVYGLSAATLSSPQKQNEEEIDSLRIQVQDLLKRQKADRLRLAALENLVRHLIDNI